MPKTDRELIDKVLGDYDIEVHSVICVYDLNTGNDYDSQVELRQEDENLLCLQVPKTYVARRLFEYLCDAHRNIESDLSDSNKNYTHNLCTVHEFIKN